MLERPEARIAAAVPVLAVERKTRRMASGCCCIETRWRICHDMQFLLVAQILVVVVVVAVVEGKDYRSLTAAAAGLEMVD